VVGERHRLDIFKTKVAGKAVKVPAAYFHTSNGALCPRGFDPARDLLELMQGAGLVEGSAWLSWQGRRLAQGKENALKRLRSDAGLYAELEADARRYVAGS